MWTYEEEFITKNETIEVWKPPQNAQHSDWKQILVEIAVDLSFTPWRKQKVQEVILLPVRVKTNHVD